MSASLSSGLGLMFLLLGLGGAAGLFCLGVGIGSYFESKGEAMKMAASQGKAPPHET